MQADDASENKSIASYKEQFPTIEKPQKDPTETILVYNEGMSTGFPKFTTPQECVSAVAILVAHSLSHPFHPISHCSRSVCLFCTLPSLFELVFFSLLMSRFISHF